MAETVGFPGEADIFVAETGRQLNADLHPDIEQGTGLDQLFDNITADVVVIDDGQMTDAFDPGIHDQMGRSLPALGGGIVDAIVKRELIPLFRHFQQMVFC